MIFPTQLLPSALGLEWGLPPNECIEQLSTAPSYLAADNAYAIVPLRFDDKLQEVGLFFEIAGNLDAQKWYGWQGNSHYLPQDLMWDLEGNLVGSANHYDSLRSGLFRIEASLFTSPIVSDYGSQVQYVDLPATQRRVTSEYDKKYSELVATYIDLLGPPVFSGPRRIKVEPTAITDYIDNLPYPYIDNPAYPREEFEDRLTYWECDEGRLQIAQRHGEIKGWPISIVLASYRSITR